MSIVKEKEITPAQNSSIISSLVINGDTSKLTQQQKVDYYQLFCKRLGLDPLSQPFKLLRLNGREVMYCDRSGAQQLNKIYNVSHEIKSRDTINGCYVVTAQASMPGGRHTESIGAVPIDNLKGDQFCNAIMKAETKAKRRATLDLLGLGILDESETDTIPNAQKVDLPFTVNEQIGNVDPAPALPALEEPTKALFKKKYDTADEISLQLDSAVEIKEVAALYFVNADLIEKNPKLKTAFTTRKNELYNNGLPQNSSVGA